MFKTVNLPIQVPDSDYCWDGKVCCGYFDNEGGHPTCDLGFSVERDKKWNIPKPGGCSTLEKVDG